MDAEEENRHMVDEAERQWERESIGRANRHSRSDSIRSVASSIIRSVSVRGMVRCHQSIL